MNYEITIAALVLGGVLGWLITRLKYSGLINKINELDSGLETQQKLADQRFEDYKNSANQKHEDTIKSADIRLADRDNHWRQLLEEREKSWSGVVMEKEAAWQKREEEKEKVHQNALLEAEKVYQSSLNAQAEHNRQQAEAMQQRFDETIAKLKAQLESSTADILKRRQEEFSVSNREQVDKVLKPLNESIEQMRKAVGENTDNHRKFEGQFAESIRQVLSESQQARKSADRLADALHGSNNTQGNWGETVLTELLEMQGLKEGVHFDTQVVMTNAGGKAVTSDRGKELKPDVILHLDKYRDVIIDAKVSLKAYLDYVNAETEEVRRSALKAHVASIENQVKIMVEKDYSSYIQPPKHSVDYAIMFVPNTAALHLACQAKPDLWRKAMEKKVYIADEQTLYAALKIVEMTWRHIVQADNHREVFELANEMLQRVGKFMQNFKTLGDRLTSAQSEYEKAFKKLQEGGQSVPQTCHKLIKLGAKVEVPSKVEPELLGVYEDDDNEQPELIE